MAQFNVCSKGETMPCPKCSYELKETKDLSMSTRGYKYGRQGVADDEDDNAWGYYGYGSRAGSHFGLIPRPEMEI